MKPADFLARCLDERLDEGVLRIDRAAYTAPELFGPELEYLFEGNWVYICHESQVREPGDFMTVTVGRQPLIVLRDAQCQLRVLINACAHRGALVLRQAKGNTKFISCPFHGWTYGLDGGLVDVPFEAGGGYPAQFDKAHYGLAAIPRLESYRGFVFGCFDPSIGSLGQWLGDARTFIDLIVDQAPNGLEVVAGSSNYSYRGNWKLTYENQADGYHAWKTHGNYIRTIQNRMAQDSGDSVRSMDLSNFTESEGGFYDLGNGHVLLWWDWSEPRNRPIFERYAELEAKFGRERADWMVKRARNLILYPNVLLADHMSTQIRTYRPASVDATEISIYCLGERNEPNPIRDHRLRQYEDFFNVSGMATCDDAAEFEACQQGYAATPYARWNDLSRGLRHLKRGPDDKAQRLGINPLYSGGKVEDEQVIWAQCRHWRDALAERIGRSERRRAAVSA